MLNNQPPEKIEKSQGSSVGVHSIFHTIQGEGPFAGCNAIFIRLTGCNLQCPMCDTEYTAQRTELNLEAVADYVADVAWPPPKLIVVTGGEPFRQNIVPFLQRLIFLPWRPDVQVETNGTIFRDGLDMLWGTGAFHIVCSPKMHIVREELLPYIRAFKYVASVEDIDENDGLPNQALEHPVKGRLYRPPAHWTGEIYLQPLDEQDDEKNQRNTRAVVTSCMRFGHRLCLQTHKIIGVA